MKAVIVALVLMGIPFCTAPRAAADQYDFLDMLDNSGVAYGDLTDTIDLGKGICHHLRAGYDPGAVVRSVSLGGGWTPYEAGLVVGAAATSMCPDTWPVLNRYMHPQSDPSMGDGD